MRKTTRLLLTLVLLASATTVAAQNPSPERLAQAEKAFETANSLLAQHKAELALIHYKQALAILPDEPAVLFNAASPRSARGISHTLVRCGTS